MKVNQVYQLLNEVARETFGESGIVSHDLTGLISLGDTLSSADSDYKDKFFNVLVDRIGKTVLRSLDIFINYPNLMLDAFEFGAILQKISVDLLDAQESEPWKIGNNNYIPNQFAITKANVRQVLFDGIKVWSVKVTIPDNITKSAFTSESEMGAFLNGLISSMTDSMTLKINDMNRIAVNNFIGEKISSGKNVVHLLTEYNSFKGETITASEYIATPEAYRFTAKKVRDYINYMSNPNSLFNENGVVRATPRDNMHVFLNSEFVSNFDIYLQSDTFHNDLTKLPLYQPVDFWQSMNTTANAMPDIRSATTINITTSSGSEVNTPYIIGALFDRMAVATTAYNVRTTTDRNNDGEYTNYSNKCDIGHLNDMSENGVIFVID